MPERERPERERRETVAIRMPPSLWAEAQRIARNRGETVTAPIERALRRYVRRYGGQFPM